MSLKSRARLLSEIASELPEPLLLVLKKNLDRPPKGPGGRPAQSPATSQDPKELNTFHFRLGHTHSGGAAVEQQRYIEREEACAASFGTLAPTLEERLSLWKEVARRSRSRYKRGSIKILADGEEANEAASHCRKWVEANLADLIRDGSIKEGRPEKLRNALEGKEDLKLNPKEEDSFGKLLERFWTICKPFAGEEGPGPEEEKDLAKSLGNLEGFRITKARNPIVQRRVIVELAHELSTEEMEEALRTWCKRSLEATGKCGWHAAVHAPENSNDPRNWHGHVVYTQFPMEKDAGVKGLPPGSTLPANSPVVRTLSGNGPEKRLGTKRLIQSWRVQMANIQNEILRRKGLKNKYDPRSYKAMGLRKVPGKHLGRSRAAMELRGEEQKRPWDGLSNTWEQAEATNEEILAWDAACLIRTAEVNGQSGKPVLEALREHLPEKTAAEASRIAEENRRSAGSEMKERNREKLLLARIEDWTKIPAGSAMRRGREALRIREQAIKEKVQNPSHQEWKSLQDAAGVHAELCAGWTKALRSVEAQSKNASRKDGDAMHASLMRNLERSAIRPEWVFSRADSDSITQRALRHREALALKADARETLQLMRCFPAQADAIRGAFLKAHDLSVLEPEEISLAERSMNRAARRAQVLNAWQEKSKDPSQEESRLKELQALAGDPSLDKQDRESLESASKASREDLQGSAQRAEKVLAALKANADPEEQQACDLAILKAAGGKPLSGFPHAEQILRQAQKRTRQGVSELLEALKKEDLRTVLEHWLLVEAKVKNDGVKGHDLALGMQQELAGKADGNEPSYRTFLAELGLLDESATAGKRLRASPLKEFRPQIERIRTEEAERREEVRKALLEDRPGLPSFATEEWKAMLAHTDPGLAEAISRWEGRRDRAQALTLQP